MIMAWGVALVAIGPGLLTCAPTAHGSPGLGHPSQLYETITAGFSGTALLAERMGKGADAAVAVDTTIPILLQRLRALDGVPLPPLYVSAPALSTITPIAFGASAGQIVVGVEIQTRTRYTNSADGGIGMALGLGDPARLGLDLGVAVLDLLPNRSGRDGPAQRGSFNLKVHHTFPAGAAVAAGAENVLRWGGSDVPASIYVVASARSPAVHGDSISGRFYGSVGVGTGRFQSEQAVIRDRHTVGVFGSLALSVVKSSRLFAEWTGEDLGLGASVVPARDVPAVISVGLMDVTGNAGDGARWIFSLTYSFGVHLPGNSR